MRVLGWLGASLAAAALLAGCSDDQARPESPTNPTASASATSAPPTAGPSSSTPSNKAQQTSYGSEGFTVRYLDANGKVRTLQPKDFRR